MDTNLLVNMLPWLISILVWDSIWKAIALWKAGRNNQLAWYICLMVFNTIGILPIIYIKFFQKKQSN